MFTDFENFNTRIGRAGGFHLGNAARHKQWKTNTGKANFLIASLPTETSRQAAQKTTKERVFSLTTFRAHDQYNTTVYRRDDRYRGIKGARKVLFINPEDMSAIGVDDGDKLDIAAVSNDGRERSLSGYTVVPYDIPMGCVGAYFPETNVLVPLDSHGPRSGTPTSKCIPVTLSPSE